MSTEPQTTALTRPLDVGLQTRIRAALSDIADVAAARSTRVAIVVPGDLISEAMYEIFTDAARIPDYAPDAPERRYSSVVEYVSDEIPPDPIDLYVYADTAHEGAPRVALRVADGEAITDLTLDLGVAEEFFLAGLAAVAHLRATPVD